VLVRLMDASRMGQMDEPVWTVPVDEIKVPKFITHAALSGFSAEMRKPGRSSKKTYIQSLPRLLTPEQWVDNINDT